MGKLLKLSEYIDKLEAHGQYWLSKPDARAAIGCSEVALEESIRRLIHKKRIVLIRNGFLVIVPIKYKSKGIIPADWLIDPFMAYLQLPYYISLLSAASYYGAAHQAPQIFQVMAEKKLRRIAKNSLGITFYKKDNFELAFTRDIQVSTGYAKIATPELTAIELVQYYRASGYLSNVATVLSELQESLDPEKLMQLAKPSRFEWPVLQRLGYLMSLDEVGGAELVLPLKKLIQDQKPRIVPLQPGQPYHKKPSNVEWRLWINEEVETDQ